MYDGGHKSAVSKSDEVIPGAEFGMLLRLKGGDRAEMPSRSDSSQGRTRQRKETAADIQGA